jgi:hypothetical protein
VARKITWAADRTGTPGEPGCKPANSTTACAPMTAVTAAESKICEANDRRRASGIHAHASATNAPLVTMATVGQGAPPATVTQVTRTTCVAVIAATCNSPRRV